MSEYTIINADDVDDVYAGSDVPGEFHDEQQELYLVMRGLTMRFGDDIRHAGAGSVVRSA